MTVFAYLAAREALADYPGYPADLGLAIGGTMGSPDTLIGFFTEYLGRGSLEAIRGNTLFKVMGHGAAASAALALGLSGRILAPSAACAAGLVAIGLGFETIASGRESAMLCGGAEEFNPLTAATFDHILAASRNPDPAAASRPFDAERDGLVCSEGAGMVLLENLENARRRGARILAEVIGFATNSSPGSLIHPDAESMRRCMAKALDDAAIRSPAVSAINAHATATIEGDRAEGRAIAELFGRDVPVGSLKGQLGHGMAASGAVELVACVRMLAEGIILPNHNLETPDPECGGIRLPREPARAPLDIVLKNSFALGGVNASMVIGKYAD